MKSSQHTSDFCLVSPVIGTYYIYLYLPLSPSNRDKEKNLIVKQIEV